MRPKHLSSGEDQQAFGVAVEATGSINVGDIDKIGKRSPLILIGERREHVEWLPKPQSQIRVIETHR